MLSNKCSYFQGFFAQFKIDYTKFNESGATYEAAGGDIEVCFKTTTSFPIEVQDVYVTDYLKKVTTWPMMYYPGPLTPPVLQTELYASRNGFSTKFYAKMGD